jgi:hypothetical protein
MIHKYLSILGLFPNEKNLGIKLRGEYFKNWQKNRHLAV